MCISCVVDNGNDGDGNGIRARERARERQTDRQTMLAFFGASMCAYNFRKAAGLVERTLAGPCGKKRDTCWL